EAVIGGDIEKTQGQLAARRPDLVLEKEVDGDGAAQLVAVGHRVDHDVRPGLVAVEGGDVGDPGIARAVRRDVGRDQLYLVDVVGHGRPLLENDCGDGPTLGRRSGPAKAFSGGLM